METTLKELNLYGLKAVENYYSFMVKQFLEIGFTFSFKNNGTQGELAKTTMVRKQEPQYIYCIWAYRKSEQIDGLWVDTIRVEFKRYDVNCPTLWMEKGDCVISKVFYEIRNSYKDSVFVLTLDEYKFIQNVRCERQSIRLELYQSAKESDITNESLKKAVLPLVKKHKGYKSTKISDVIKVVRRNGFGYSVYLSKGIIDLNYVA